jgi:phosphoserine phosphatase
MVAPGYHPRQTRAAVSTANFTLRDRGMTLGPLPSWNDGAAKSAILDFVARVTKDGGPDFVPPAQRIATFDNDGTLWCEQPIQVQLFFLIDRVKELAAKDLSLKERQPYKALLEHDMKTLHALGKQALFELAFATHAGMSEEEFDETARAFFATSKHPKFGRLFKHLTYQPQVELLSYLRDNGFKTYIVSGGGIDLIRAFAEEAYGIPREQVVGSSVKTRFEINDGRGVLAKLSELNSFDDREVKPANIGLHIGRRPILAFGNSDGDLAMLRYCKTGKGARLSLLVHHDDAEREVAYDRDFKLSPLVEALDKADAYGITLVSMKRDWKAVFAPAQAGEQRGAA